MMKAINWSRRSLRTMRNVKVPNIVDIESQLAAYPPETKKQVLEQFHQLQPIDKSKQRSADEYNAGIITDYLNSASSIEDLDSTFWNLVKDLARSGTKSKSETYTDLFVNLFEAAKAIESFPLKQTMIYEIGRYIYRQKRVRFDPVNEVEFLDSLVANSRPFVALKLWESRRSKEDVAGSVFWSEVGVLYHLDARLTSQADKLAKEMSDQVPLRVVVALINAWSNEIRRGRSVDIASQHLAHWCSVLLKYSADENAQEAFETSLHALIISRSWPLANRVLNLIPSEAWSNREKFASLSRALSISASSRVTTEADFLPFFESVLTQVPALALDPAVSASLLLYFAKLHDLDATADLCADLKQRGIELPLVFQKATAKSLLAISGNETGKSEIFDPEHIRDEPGCFVEILRNCYHNRKLAVEKVTAYLDAGGKLTPKLACLILRKRLFDSKNTAQILALGVDTNSWNYIWYLSAMDRINLPLAQISSATLMPETIQYMCQAYAIHYPTFETGVHELFRKLSGSPTVSPAEVILVLGTLKKLSTGRRFQFRPPKPTKTHNPAARPEGIPWSDVAKQAAAVLEMPELMQTSVPS